MTSLSAPRIVRLFWILPLAFYGLTACRWPGWIDAPMIAGHVEALRLGTWVNDHNLFHLIGWIWKSLIPWGDLHFRLNLLCAVCGTVTVHFLFLAGWRLTRNLAAAAAGGIALMFSHSLWWHSTILEVYTLNTALLAVMIYFIVRFDEEGRIFHLAAAVFVWGLACSNHVLMGLFVFAFLGAAFLGPRRREVLRPRVLLILTAAFLAGFSLYLFVFLREFVRRLAEAGPVDAGGVWRLLRQMADSATGGHFRRFMFPDFMSPRVKRNWRLNYLFLLFMNFPSAAFVAGWLGLVAFARNRRFRFAFVFFALGLAAQAVWSSNYLIWDMYAFGLPVWVMFGFAGILGFDWLFRSGAPVRVAALILLPTLLIGPILYARIPVWAQKPGFWKKYFSQFDYVSNIWDPPSYFANPDKHAYDDVARIAEAVFQKLPQGARLYDDDGKGYYPLALYYKNVLKVRPDIQYRQIFGPEMNDMKARVLAEAMKRDLESGAAVFVSSPHWPERPVLNHLFRMLSEGAPGGRSPERMSPEELETTFPRYRLERMTLIEGKPFFIYRLVSRTDSP